MSISKTTETDVILNKANVALARSQRLVASWLPPKTAEEQANTKSEEQLQREEDEIFTAVPETLGVGAPLPEKAADGSWNRTELDSNDKLRKQLLGKNYKRVMAANAGNTSKTGIGGRSGTATSNTTSGVDGEDEDDDDEGRTALVGRKKGGSAKKNLTVKKRKVDESTSEVPETGGEDEVKTGGGDDGDGDAEFNQGGGPAARSSKGRKKATSFLDEILAERSKKRKKR